jgi:hypothetical protein
LKGNGPVNARTHRTRPAHSGARGRACASDTGRNSGREMKLQRDKDRPCRPAFKVT